MRLAWITIALASGLGVACGGDAPAGPDATIYCAKTIYDPCNTEHDCASTSCLPVTSTLLICTMACTPGDASTCPTQNGSAVTCGSNSLCQPAAPNACTLNP